MEIRFEEILNKLDLGVLVLDKNYHIVYANQKAEELFDLDLSSAPTCYSLFYQYSDPCSGCVKEFLEPDKPRIKLTLSFGDKTYLIEYCYFSEDKLFVFVRDAQEEIYYKNTYFTLLENLPLLVFFLKKGKIKYLNRFSEKNLGYTKQELIEKSFTEVLVSPEEKFSIENC